MHKKIVRILTVAIVLAATVYTSMGAPVKTKAAALTLVSDEMSRIQTAQAGSHRIRFKNTSAIDQGTDTITLLFAAGFNISTVAAGDIDICHTANSDWTTGCTTDEMVLGTAGVNLWGFGLNSQTITLTAPSDAAGTGGIAAGQYITIEIGTNASGGTHNITNPATGDNYKLDIGGTFGDTGFAAISIIDNDQLVVNARTDATLAYTLGANSLDLTTLSSTVIKTGTVSMTASTNAANGYEIKYYGDTLKYGAFSITAFSASGAQSSPGSEQFGLRVASASGGSGAGVSPYNINTTPNTYALTPTSTAVAQVKVAGAAGPSATTTYSIEYGANISAITEPGAYTTTHTWICTGLF